jgi:hypothetical protein
MLSRTPMRGSRRRSATHSTRSLRGTGRRRKGQETEKRQKAEAASEIVTVQQRASTTRVLRTGGGSSRKSAAYLSWNWPLAFSVTIPCRRVGQSIILLSR